MAGKRFEFTKQEWSELCALFLWRCARCGEPGSPNNPLSADHIIPYSKGGHGRITNMQPLCRACNTSKRDRSADDYRIRYWARNRVEGEKLGNRDFMLSLARRLLPYFETLPDIEEWVWHWRLKGELADALRNEVEAWRGSL